MDKSNLMNGLINELINKGVIAHAAEKKAYEVCDTYKEDKYIVEPYTVKEIRTIIRITRDGLLKEVDAHRLNRTRIAILEEILADDEKITVNIFRKIAPVQKGVSHKEIVKAITEYVDCELVLRDEV